MSPLQKALKKLGESQLVLKDSNVATGLVEIKVVEEILQQMEIDMVEEAQIKTNY